MKRSYAVNTRNLTSELRTRIDQESYQAHIVSQTEGYYRCFEGAKAKNRKKCLLYCPDDRLDYSVC